MLTTRYNCAKVLNYGGGGVISTAEDPIKKGACLPEYIVVLLMSNADCSFKRKKILTGREQEWLPLKESDLPVLDQNQTCDRYIEGQARLVEVAGFGPAMAIARSRLRVWCIRPLYKTSKDYWFGRRDSNPQRLLLVQD